jgi:RNA polymerase sigma factor (TIGR02999 family)
MRRILVENARRKGSRKHGEGLNRVELEQIDIAAAGRSDDLIALDDALSLLTQEDPQTAELVKLRYFSGLSNKQAAEVLGISPRTADFRWSFARAWLFEKLEGGSARHPENSRDTPQPA